MKKMTSRVTRRRFLAEAAATAGALAVAFPSSVVAAEAPQWGDLKGRFVYDGKPPERKRLKVDRDVAFCGKFDIRDESLVVERDGGLANVFVYLRTRRVAICPELEKTAAKDVLLDNRDAIFKPHCMKIWLGKQEYHIVNSDPIAQTVAFSPLGDAPANIVLAAAPGENVEARWKFHRRQAVPVGIHCNYHSWESALVLPLDHPYVDISAADGTFCIAKLPVGKWEFQAWHEKAERLDTPQWPKGRFTATIKPGVNDLGTIKISPAMFKKK
jgi:hypothetical protein